MSESLFLNALKLSSENVFIKQGSQELSFQKFKAFAKKISHDLNTFQENDLVLIDIRNPFYFAAYVFACFHLKIKPALLNYYFKKDQVESVIHNNTYKAIITDQEHTLSIPIVKIDSSKKFEFEDGDFNIDLNSEILFFTSGSIQSKTCVLTLKNFFYNALGSLENIPFTSKDIWGLSLPLFHVGGFSLFIRGILAQAQICALDNNKNYQEQFEQYRVTHISFVSTQFIRYLDQVKGRTPDHILLGGSAIPMTALKKALLLKLPIYKSYGMTEMCSQICTTHQLTTSDDLQLSGYVLKYRELKIENKKIYVRGPCLFKGYMKKNHLEAPFEKDGWFFTKDNGEFVENNLHVLGRSDRIFQSAGENISPEVIEQELLKVPGVSKAYVCPEIDTEYGFRPVAYIERNDQVSDEMILSQLSKNLSGLHRPKALKPWNESPKTSWKQ